MNVNGVSGYSQLEAYNAYSANNANTASNATESESKTNAVSEAAAVYEKSSEAAANESGEAVSTKYKPNDALIEMMKADQEKMQNQLMSYVQETLMGQGNALATSSDDIWKFLASGNYTVDEAARKKAEESLADGGYWSPEKTSDRIVEFAKALTGGDPSKIETMRSAIDKGFKEATKAWGKDLPDITNNTYDLIQKKLNAWADEANKPQEQAEAAGTNEAVTVSQI